MNDAYTRERFRTISQAFAELAAYDPSAGSGIQVRRGDNLFSLVEQAPTGASFVLDPNFEQAGDFTWTKPMRLAGSLALGMPMLYGTQTILADVDFTEIGFQGVNRDWAILQLRNTGGAGPSFADCGFIGSANGQRRGVETNGVGGLFDGGSVTNIWHTEDAQAFMGWDGTRGLRIRNMHLEASGEVIMFGGGDPTSEDRIPCDWEVFKCTLTRPLPWRGRSDLTVKNLFEVKNSKRGRFEGNVCEYSWAQGQIGWGLVLTVRNQDGTAPFSTIEDVTIVKNKFRHMGSGIQILGRDNRNPSGVMRNVLLEDNRFEDVDPVAWADGIGGRLIDISGGPQNLQLVRTKTFGQNLNSAFYFSGEKLAGFQVIDHEADEGQYGLFRDGGTPGIQSWIESTTLDAKWDRVTFHRPSGGANYQYPAGTTIIEDAA